MNLTAHHQADILQVNGGIRSEKLAQELQSALEGLTGVYSTEVTREGVCLHYDPDSPSEQPDDKVLKFPA